MKEALWPSWVFSSTTYSMLNYDGKSPHLLILLLHVFTSFGCFSSSRDGHGSESSELVGVGVIGDLKSPFGTMMNTCMDMAISDFYSAHPHYKTRLELHKKDAKSMLDFNLALLESTKSDEVVGILGPQGSSEEAFAAAVGKNFSLPILSFTARSSAISYAENSFLVRTTSDDAVQAEALIAICRGFNWTEVVLLHESTEYDNRFQSQTIKRFQDNDIRLARIVSIPTSVLDGDILKELKEANKDRTKVFVVHMSPALGHQLFKLVNTEGMMSDGYAWIVTDSLSVFLNSSSYNKDGSMDGVLGIRPHIYASENLESFHHRWKTNMLVDKFTTPIMELNIYGIWAYDAITALAIAVEATRQVSSSSLQVNTMKNRTDETKIRISSYGTQLLSKLSSTKFRGLAGDFHLTGGKLKPPPYEIFNIIGTGERKVGFWTSDRGITRELSASGGPQSSAWTEQFRRIMWPGDSVNSPKGWKYPPIGKLRVGIPCGLGVEEFVNGTSDINNRTHATGYAIDLFLSALKVIPFPVNYDFLCYSTKNFKWSYDDMLHKIPNGSYHMVVADVTNWAARTSYVDFSQPYTEAGIGIVIKNKKPINMWIFIKAFKWDLWLAIILGCIFIGVALHILERRATNNDEESSDESVAQPRSIYWYPIAILAFPERNVVSNNWSVVTLVCWLFMAYILMQSFTANLSTILTIDQLNMKLSKNCIVGYYEGSYMKDFLIHQLNISESRLKPYSSFEECHDAMVRGRRNEGMDVVIDEIPLLKLFINKYESKYKMIKPINKGTGFVFAFRKGSPLVSYFSRAISNITQGPEIKYLQQKNFGPGFSLQDPLSSVISQGRSSLTLLQFAGLFLTVGSLTFFALFCAKTPIGRKFADVVGRFIQNGFTRRATQVHFVIDPPVDGDASSSGGDNSGEFAREDNENDAIEHYGNEFDETITNDEVDDTLDDAVSTENHH